MDIIEKLFNRWRGIDYPFLVHANGSLRFDEVANQEFVDLTEVNSGDVVALIGDFNPQSILTLLQLIDKGVVLVPLTVDTRAQHEYFFDSALVDVVIEEGNIKRITHNKKHLLIEELRAKQHAGLVLFSTGTTGRPKAILHDLTLFMQRFETPRPTLKTINFLLFDHIGGLNTLLHTLFNKGTVVAPKSRRVEDIIATCAEHEIEVLPTTPTFLRMMLMSGLIPDGIPKSLRIITYGTERMDQPTLDALCELLPNVEFRQTFGMSELGIVRVKSQSSNSLYMKIGGEGVETRVVDNVLEIRSKARMLGYLNAETPFDKEGWYNTKDIVEELNGFYKVIGRTSEVINVGGLKFMASEVERIALQFDHVELAKVEAKRNPITGQHVELTIQVSENFEIDRALFNGFMANHLPSHMQPRRIRFGKVSVGHRFKKQ
ncbi:fatty acid--CoA ligase family protein [Marinobacterium sp. LSUCC0821]|uniref:ANL family adenylate-forming protein n=1 Tax=Marinobacterium sp. LSUCC0821 TaxID=2668067 RepID=UPI0014526127|nr:fatty acid--CoA ligase family protein [Marinobacterium sp. LSUCC0821]QJD72171.1 long-chain fatty acid--CoA ligase [Marinobacterium sp. LSUCC0821]